jgi:hypothetical protein
LLKEANKRITLDKASGFLLLTEPAWVFAAVSLVYLSLIFDWASFLPWLMLAIAFIPFPLRQIRLGYLSQRTPFDIPLIVFLVAIIVGMSVSDHPAISLGAFQTFLAMLAFYYSVINYSRPAGLIKWGLGIAILGLFIPSVFVLSKAFYPPPHGLGIGLVIIGAIALGIAIFGRKAIPRVLSGILCSAFLGWTIFFLSETGALHRLFAFQTFRGRWSLWSDTFHLMHGSSIFSGLGLGCWPLISPSWHVGHVHNAYLELYVNTGVFGIIAFICFAAVVVKLAIDIIHSSRKNRYYGLSIGVLLAILAVALAGIVESAPFGFGIVRGGAGYHYIFSPIPWVLAGLLVMARRLLRQPVADDSSIKESETSIPG